jgi:hypothetical protein
VIDVNEREVIELTAIGSTPTATPTGTTTN